MTFNVNCSFLVKMELGLTDNDGYWRDQYPIE